MLVPIAGAPLPAGGGVVDAGPRARSRRSPAEAREAARSSSGAARAAVAVGMAGLPLLRPAVAGNFTPADAAILVGIGGVLLWARSSRLLLRAAYLTPVTVTMVAGLAAGMTGIDPNNALLSVAQDLFLLLWALACLNLGRDPASARFLVRSWCATASIWAVALFVIVGRDAITRSSGDTRLAFTADTNGAGLYFVLSIFVIVAARWPRRRRWRWFAIGFLAADTVLTGSLGALSGLFAGLAISVVLSVLARRGPAPALAMFLVIGLSAMSAGLFVQRYQVINKAHGSSNAIIRNSLGRGAQSSEERAALTKETLGLLKTASVLGAGPNTTEELLRAEQAPYVKQAHNDWIASLVERGVLGFVAIGLLSYEVTRRASSATSPSRLAAGYAQAFPAAHYLPGGVVTIAIFSFTHEVLHDRTAWTLLGLLAVLSVFGHDGTHRTRGEG